MAILVIGMGNILMGDDGLGVHALRALAEDPPAGADFLELGTSLSDCFSLLEGYDHIIALDAVVAEGAPGTLYWLTKAHFARLHGRRLTLHDGDLLDALDIVKLRGREPVLHVAGMEPEIWQDWSLELSGPVKRNMPDYLKMVRTKLRQMAESAGRRP